MTVSLRITAPWRLGDPEDGRLYAVVEVNDVPHHLEAVPVRRSRGKLQGVTPIAEDVLSDYCTAFVPDSLFMVTTINKKRYCVFMSPFAR